MSSPRSPSRAQAAITLPLHCDFSCRWSWPLSLPRLTCSFSCVLRHSPSRPRRWEDAADRHPWLSGNDLPDGAVGLSDHVAVEEGKCPKKNGPSLPKRGMSHLPNSNKCKSAYMQNLHFKDVGQKFYL